MAVTLLTVPVTVTAMTATVTVTVLVVTVMVTVLMVTVRVTVATILASSPQSSRALPLPSPPTPPISARGLQRTQPPQFATQALPPPSAFQGAFQEAFQEALQQAFQ